MRFFIVYELSPEARRRGIADLTRGGSRRGLVRHQIGATLPLARTAEAHERVEQGRVVGNVIVAP